MPRLRPSLVLLAASLPAWGDVAFTNLGPGDTYGALNFAIPSGQAIAVDFVPTVSGNLTTIRLPLPRVIDQDPVPPC